MGGEMNDRDRLLQEDYVDTKHGPWKVLVVCQTLNRTTWVQAEPTLRKIFGRWPSPKDMALMPVHEMFELEEMLKPLGMSKNRKQFMLAMSLQYYEASQQYDSFADYPVREFKGCGQYAEDAWSLFVLKRMCTPADRRLREYAQQVGLYKEVSKDDKRREAFCANVR
jgi:endonuclease III-like uncharacterized protein